MKVLHIIHDLTIGGAEKLVFDMLRYGHKLNQPIELLTLKKSNSEMVNELQILGVKVYSLSCQSIHSLLLPFKIAGFLKKHHYQVVHVHLFPTLYYVSFLRLMHLINSDIKLVYTEHSTSNKRRSYPLFQIIEKKVYGCYDKIIAISDGVKKSLCKWLEWNINTPKIEIVNNGVDFELYNTAKAYTCDELLLRKDTFKILMTARFTEAKDHLTVIRAIDKLIKSDSDFELVFVGNGDTRAAIEQEVAELQLTKNVHFLGERNDVQRIIKSVDVCVLSSFWEGFGLSAIEYMAGGKPVITTNVDGLRNVVGAYGVLFEVGDYQQLADNIQQLKTDTMLYDKYVKLGLIRARMFDIPVLMVDHIRVYEKINK